MANMEILKRGPNFIVYKSGEQKLIKIEGVRFSYPNFGTPKVDEDDDGKETRAWAGVAMLPKATHVAAKDAFVEIMNELMAKNEVKIAPENRCIKNGDDKEDEAMAGHWLISFSEKGKHRPSARTIRGEPMSEIDEIDDKFYGGCWGSVLLRPWYFNGKSKRAKAGKSYPKRICSGYQGVQFLKDDTPFGQGRVDDTDAWGDESGGSSGGSASGDDDDGL